MNKFTKCLSIAILSSLAAPLASLAATQLHCPDPSSGSYTVNGVTFRGENPKGKVFYLAQIKDNGTYLTCRYRGDAKSHGPATLVLQRNAIKATSSWRMVENKFPTCGNSNTAVDPRSCAFTVE